MPRDHRFASRFQIFNEYANLECASPEDLPMAAMLIGLWTAFESLAQDTWIAAANARPVPLAQRVVTDRSVRKGDQSKSINWNVISNAGFNLSKSMGTVLVRERKADFQTMEN